MIGYMMLGSRDVQRAATLYDVIAGELGGQRAMDFGHAIFWVAPNTAMIGITAKPANGQEATVGNGVMAAFSCNSPEQVQKVYQLAADMGCQDEGGPGERSPGFYAAYFRDLDGNKLAAVHVSRG